ncbi:MAG: GNAT family N-acetyltransferase [Mogibacterium sp.]|nr:GNAT family N-acetyltransferase [Mogibacterium sp.]
MKKLFSEIPYIEGDSIVLHGITRDDADSLRELTESGAVYRFLPTFLFEKKYDSIEYVIDHLYDECFRESIILGIYLKDNGNFCGIAEMYGFRDEIHKISVGYRLLERSWGQGVASKALSMMIDYLYNETDIEIITASTMIENRASARVLEKNGFDLVVHAVPEDWGYEEPTITDKWIR